MMDASKYRVGYFPVGKQYKKWVEKDHIEKPPVWCSVDMRDGNQSLIIPMSLEEKLTEFVKKVKVGNIIIVGWKFGMSEGMKLVGYKRCGELILENLRKG